MKVKLKIVGKRPKEKRRKTNNNGVICSIPLVQHPLSEALAKNKILLPVEDSEDKEFEVGQRGLHDVSGAPISILAKHDTSTVTIYTVAYPNGATTSLSQYDIYNYE